jgi:hypothetical protein
MSKAALVTFWQEIPSWMKCCCCCCGTRVAQLKMIGSCFGCFLSPRARELIDKLLAHLHEPDEPDDKQKHKDKAKPPAAKVEYREKENPPTAKVEYRDKEKEKEKKTKHKDKE